MRLHGKALSFASHSTPFPDRSPSSGQEAAAPGSGAATGSRGLCGVGYFWATCSSGEAAGSLSRYPAGSALALRLRPGWVSGPRWAISGELAPSAASEGPHGVPATRTRTTPPPARPLTCHWRRLAQHEPPTLPLRGQDSVSGCPSHPRPAPPPRPDLLAVPQLDLALHQRRLGHLLSWFPPRPPPPRPLPEPQAPEPRVTFKIAREGPGLGQEGGPPRRAEPGGGDWGLLTWRH